MPRTYTLGRRAEQFAQTHERILVAAIELYQERGVSRTTMQDVAGRADVAPGTVANHFRSAPDLARAVAERLLSDLQPPTASVFDGLEDPAARVARLARELAAFYERSEPWYLVQRQEPAGFGDWSEAEARWYADLDALVRMALGPLAQDRDVVAVVSAALGPGLLIALRAGGRSYEAAAELVAELLGPWLQAKAKTMAKEKAQRRSTGAR